MVLQVALRVLHRVQVALIAHADLHEHGHDFAFVGARADRQPQILLCTRQVANRRIGLGLAHGLGWISRSLDSLHSRAHFAARVACAARAERCRAQPWREPAKGRDETCHKHWIHSFGLDLLSSIWRSTADRNDTYSAPRCPTNDNSKRTS